jgi:hypothetical protein
MLLPEPSDHCVPPGPSGPSSCQLYVHGVEGHDEAEPSNWTLAPASGDCGAVPKSAVGGGGVGDVVGVLSAYTEPVWAPQSLPLAHVAGSEARLEEAEPKV